MSNIHIQVPFLCKAKAKELGVIFNREDRRWYIEESKYEYANHELQQYFLLKQSEIESNSHINNYNNLEKTSYNSILQNTTNYSTIFTEDDWEKVIEENDSVIIALSIHKVGLPESEEIRTKLLKILGRRGMSDYPITYDGMIRYSECFRELYPKERIKDLIKECIMGEKPYQEEIRLSNLSEEEKALLFFVLPI